MFSFTHRVSDLANFNIRIPCQDNTGHHVGQRVLLRRNDTSAAREGSLDDLTHPRLIAYEAEGTIRWTRVFILMPWTAMEKTTTAYVAVRING